jgi:uncharacterized membrane protein
MRYVSDSSATRLPQDAGEQNDHEKRPARRRRRPRAINIAIAALAVIVLILLLVALPRFLTFNAETACRNNCGVQDFAKHPLFFPILMVHILSSTVALIACVFQVWPWLRSRRPRLHRYLGRAYVWAGVFPAAPTALVLAVVWGDGGPIALCSDGISAVLWLAITAYGYVLARRGWYADHRRWMLRSFALTSSTIVGGIVVAPIGLWLKPMLATTFAGNQAFLTQAWSGLNVWVAWVLPLLAVEWWLERDQLRSSARRRRREATKALDAVHDQ